MPGLTASLIVGSKLKMKRVLKYGLISISIIVFGLFVAYGIFISTFDLFGEPKEQVLDTNCDYEGLRQVTIFKYGGNAVTNPAIKVSIDLGCGGRPNDSEKKIVFSAEHLGGTSVQTEWISRDTLNIVYSNKLEPTTKINTVSLSDSTLDLWIRYKKM